VRLRATILVKLLGALVLPVVVLFTVFAIVAHGVSRRDLDDELGRRLEAIAASAASQQNRGQHLVKLQEGHEDDVYYRSAVRRLSEFAKATGAHLAMFDRELHARGDSTGDVPIGKPYYRAELDRAELARVFERGETASSVTFTGHDGVIYKAGYAPVRASADEEGSPVVLALSAQAPASYFARLEDLRERLFAWGAGLAAISILAAVIIRRRRSPGRARPAPSVPSPRRARRALPPPP
jgi:hypothetical protein